jgi:hypothetical protein
MNEQSSPLESGALAGVLKYMDIIAATLLGIATVAAAFAAYQSALWGGNCLTAYNQAVIRFGDANREYLNGALATSFDTMVYLESLREDGRTKEDVDKMMSKDLVRASSWADKSYEEKRLALGPVKVVEIEAEIEKKWDEFEGAQAEKQSQMLGEIADLEKKVAYLPFLESDAYKNGKRAVGQAMEKEAQAKMAEGLKANGIGDSFTLATVYFAISLFFAGMASVLRDDKIKLVFLGGATVVFLLAFLRMLFLPFA